MHKKLIWLFLPIIFLLISNKSFAGNPVEIIADGEYVMGAGETMEVAEERAKKSAMQKAAEQAGAFVKSYTKVKNLALESDVIEVIANHSMKVNILEKKKVVLGDVDAIRFYVKIRATMTEEEIEANLKKVREDQTIVDAYNRLKAEYEKQAKEIAELKRKFMVEKGEGKGHILTKIREQEILFKANLLFEKAEQSMFYFKYIDATESLTSAIALNPNFADAYAARANIYIQLHEYRKAREDVNKAIEIEPKNPFYYAVRAMTYAGCSDKYMEICKNGDDGMLGDMKCSEISDDCEKALNDIEKAISLKPDIADWYMLRATIYVRTNMVAKAISDLNKVITLGLRDEWPSDTALAYLFLSNLAKEKKDNYAALNNLTSAIAVLENSKYYNETLIKTSKILKNIIRNKQITEDEAKSLIKKELNIDLNDERGQSMFNTRVENLRYLHELYLNRSEIYKTMRYNDNAKRDLVAACEIYWDEDSCKVLEEDNIKPTDKQNNMELPALPDTDKDLSDSQPDIGVEGMPRPQRHEAGRDELSPPQTEREDDFAPPQDKELSAGDDIPIPQEDQEDNDIAAEKLSPPTVNSREELKSRLRRR